MHNPSGEGVNVVSSRVQAKIEREAEKASKKTAVAELETRVKEGTAKRNIVRKKTAEKESGNYNSQYKKQGMCCTVLSLLDNFHF